MWTVLSNVKEFLHNLYEERLESPTTPYIVEEPPDKQETMQETPCIVEESAETSDPPIQNLSGAEPKHETEDHILSGQIFPQNVRSSYGATSG